MTDQIVELIKLIKEKDAEIIHVRTQLKEETNKNIAFLKEVDLKNREIAGLNRLYASEHDLATNQQKEISDLKKEIEELTKDLAKFFLPAPKNQKGIKLIDKAIEIGLIKRNNYQGVERLICDEKNVTQEWDSLENWVNRQQKVTITLKPNLQIGTDDMKSSIRAVIENLEKEAKSEHVDDGISVMKEILADLKKITGDA